MYFEWDEIKNKANIAKHGIDFDEAIGIFRGFVLEKIDNRRDYGERRFTAIGVVVRNRNICSLLDAW
jgi:uncharacterized DUF497 family protein